MPVFLWFSVVISFTLATDLEGSIPTTTTSLINTKTTANPDVPLEFPQVSQNYTFVDNSSIRENLASHSANDTEVDDLLGKDLTKEVPESQTEAFPNLPPNPSEENEDIRSKNETEWIEDGSDTEDNKFASTTLPLREDDAPLFDGYVAVILAMTFLVTSIIAYTGLLMWRRYLEMRYGSREMLVNEDDFIDPDDMKHFSI